MNNVKTVNEALTHPEKFRVSIFGSARTKPGDPEYEMAYQLGQALAKKEIAVITGGGPGQMEAANKGHHDALPQNVASIGLTIELPWEAEGNKHMDFSKHFEHFSDRLDHFMTLSNAVVLSAGGIGTCLEFFYTLQLTQVKHICPIPIILMDTMWHELEDWLKSTPLERGFVSASDLDNIFCVATVEEAMQIINQTKEAFDQGGGQVCLNSKIYKITLSGNDNLREG